MNHYDYLEKHLGAFLSKLGIECSVNPLLVAHGDKFYGFKKKFEDAGIPFPQGVAIGLLSYFRPFREESRDTPNGWVPVEEWVINNKDRFLPLLPSVNS